MALVRAIDGPLISDEWIAEVEMIIAAKDGDGDGDVEGGVSVDRATRRVPEAVATGKAEAYVPQIVSLGPYHHRALKDAPVGDFHHRLSHLSQMEMYKLKCIRVAAGKNPELIHDVFATVVEPNRISELEHFYNWKVEMQDGDGHGSRKFGWMMTVDALFLYHFLNKVCDHDPNECDHDPNESRHPLAMGNIKCDIVKLENQIPLSLLNQVCITLKRDSGFDEFVQRGMASLCSFDASVNLRVENVDKEQHLLAYMHKYVSSFLRIQGEEAQPSGCQQILFNIGEAISKMCRICCFLSAKTGGGNFKVNARKLVRHGIRLKAFKPGEKSQKIRFDKYSDTLYLPPLNVTDIFTEVVLRNLLALELMETNRDTVMAQYVELMNSLIHTADDVKVLRRCGVIVPGNSTVSDDYIAAMWKGICKPFFAPSVEPNSRQLRKRIEESLSRNHYKLKGKAKCLVYGTPLMLGPLRLVKTAICSSVGLA